MSQGQSSSSSTEAPAHWNLQVGSSILRKDLHDLYGGVREGGISPVDTKSPNIFIFSHPRANAEHGYEPDVWLDEDTFLYCGEGPSGDQQLVRYNKSILKHRESGKTLRVFAGTSGAIVYRGAFALDEESPWFHKDSVGLDGKMRKVIMFRMVRTDASSPHRLEQAGSQAAYAWTCHSHGVGGTSLSVEELDAVTTAHFKFYSDSDISCDFEFASPILEEMSADVSGPEIDGLKERNHSIVNLRREGKTLGEIGEIFGVTRQRVQQILSKVGGPTRQEIESLRETIKVERSDDIKWRAMEMNRTDPSLTLQQVAEVLNVPSTDLGRLLFANERILFAKPARTVKLTWSDEEIMRSLKEAATLEFPLTAAAYSRLIDDGFIKGPSVARICQRFRSWQAACDVADVEAGRRTRPLNLSRWTDDDLLAAVIRYLKLSESTGSVSDYDAWASDQDDVPSMGTLRNRLGTWNEIRRTAIERMHSHAE